MINEACVAFGRRTGRAELDEHAEGVNVSEIIVSFDPESGRSREEMLAKTARRADARCRASSIAAEQPLQHLISHMLSGVKAQVGIKLYGDDLDVLRAHGRRDEGGDRRTCRASTDLLVEQQIEIPQLQIKLEPRRSWPSYGLTADEVNEFIETAMNGRVGLGSRAGRAEVRSGGAARRRVSRGPGEAAAAGDQSARPAAACRWSQRGRRSSAAADRTRSTARTCGGGSSCSATRPAAIWRASSPTSSSGWRRSRTSLPHRLLHRVRRAVREPAVGHADDWPA